MRQHSSGVEIVTSDPERPGRFRCVARHGFRVSAAWGVSWEPEPDVWRVTHLSTGRHVYEHARTGRAVACAGELANVCDVRIGTLGESPRFGEAAALLTAIVERYRAEDAAAAAEVST